jgi:hypothetical protein
MALYAMDDVCPAIHYFRFFNTILSILYGERDRKREPAGLALRNQTELG